MRKIYLACISIMLMTACQKEATLATKPTTNAINAVVTTSTIAGVSVKQDGYPYPNMSTSSSLNGGDDIGWYLDLAALSQNNVTKGTSASNLGPSYLYCGGIKTVNLYAGQNILMGTLSYANDATNLFVTYTTNPDWYMSDVHLYVGSLLTAPLSGGGTPSPGKFPIKSTFSSNSLSQDITYVIPLSSFNKYGFIIAAHASVLRVDIDGDVIAKETAWAAGDRFQSNKNWATFIPASIGDCYTSGFSGDNKTDKKD